MRFWYLICKVCCCLLGVGVSPLCAQGDAGAWRQDLSVLLRRPAPALAAMPDDTAVAQCGVLLLAADVSWGAGGKADPAYSEINYKEAAERYPRCGLLVRVQAPPGPLDADSPVGATLLSVLRGVMHRAGQGGLTPSELHLEWECRPEALPGYAAFLSMARAEAHPAAFVFTAWPAWLEAPAMADAARAADGFVLRVHGLERPATIAEIPPFCDSSQVPSWVAKAAAFGRPFRLELPTYGQLLAFRRDGRFIGLSAGGTPASWPSDARLREWRADEEELSRLARALAGDHPRECRGLLWTRIPAPGDGRCWSWRTLATVLAGKVPEASLGLECVQLSASNWECVLRNTGDAALVLPRSLSVLFVGSRRLVSAAGQGGYDFLPAPEGDRGRFVARLKAGQAPRLQPGSRLVIGTLRLEGGVVEMEAE